MYGDQFDGLRLVPFYTIHEARYMLYWRICNDQSLRYWGNE